MENINQDAHLKEIYSLLQAPISLEDERSAIEVTKDLHGTAILVTCKEPLSDIVIDTDGYINCHNSVSWAIGEGNRIIVAKEPCGFAVIIWQTGGSSSYGKLVEQKRSLLSRDVSKTVVSMCNGYKKTVQNSNMPLAGGAKDS